MDNLVSLIVPIYNVELYLEKCIDSILQQTYKNIEIILVDDCSTDSSNVIAQAFVAKYPNICRYIKRNCNGGLAAARNTGIANATGDWLCFIDSDDWISENYVQSMLEVALIDSSDLVICDYYTAWENGKIQVMNSLGALVTESPQKHKVALLRNHSVTRLYRKQFFDNAGLKFPEEVKRAEDMGVTIALLTKTDKISILNVPLYYYFQRSNSISNKNDNVDLSFYPIAVSLIEKNSDSGFEKEIEYRMILELMYGLNMLMIKSKKPKEEILENIDNFNISHHNWSDNVYLNDCGKIKRLFIKAAKYKMYFFMKIMVGLWGKIRK